MVNKYQSNISNEEYLQIVYIKLNKILLEIDELLNKNKLTFTELVKLQNLKNIVINVLIELSMKTYDKELEKYYIQLSQLLLFNNKKEFNILKEHILNLIK